MEIKKWYKTRHFETTPKHYILSPEEIKQDDEIKLMFESLDIDHSGYIELNEI